MRFSPWMVFTGTCDLGKVTSHFWLWFSHLSSEIVGNSVVGWHYWGDRIFPTLHVTHIVLHASYGTSMVTRGDAYHPWLHFIDKVSGDWSACVHVESLQYCPTLCDPMICIPPGSSVHGISQAGILEWVAISYSRGFSRPRDQTCVSYISCICRPILYH